MSKRALRKKLDEATAGCYYPLLGAVVGLFVVAMFIHMLMSRC